MIKIDTGLDGNMCAVEMKGTMIEITAELAGVVQSIYESFSKENHMAGLIFLKDFMNCMTHITEEIVKEAEEKSEESPDLMRLLAIMSFLGAMQADKRHEKKDIRSADFDSDEEFKKWFRGGDNDVRESDE